MALGKHHEEILMRRRENGARIVDEFIHPQETLRWTDQPGVFDLSPDRFAEARAYPAHVYPYPACLKKFVHS